MNNLYFDAPSLIIKNDGDIIKYSENFQDQELLFFYYLASHIFVDISNYAE